MHAEGYVESFEVSKDDSGKAVVTVVLKYFQGKGVFTVIKRLSSPGRRDYFRADESPRSKEGLGVVIVTTSKGVMTSHEAQKLGVGGEKLVELF